MTSPVTATAPVVELIAAAKVIVPASAFSVTVPEPWAVTTELTFRFPASTSTLILPFPARVRTPVLPMSRSLVSTISMFPLVALSASSVTIVVSRALPLPIPVTAENVATSAVIFSAAPLSSVIAPAESSVTSPAVPPEEIPRTRIFPAVVVSEISFASASVSDTTSIAVRLLSEMTVMEPLKVSMSVSVMALVSSMSMSPPAAPPVTLASRLVTVVSRRIPLVASSVALAAVTVRTSAVTRFVSVLLESTTSSPAVRVTSPAEPALILLTMMSEVAPFAVSEMSFASAFVSD